MNKVRWGILSTAKIGTVKVIPGMQRGEYCTVEAIASRNLATAQVAAEKLGIPKAYGSYEALLADPEIDAIYNPLPNHLHVPMSLQAIAAGKHVLCEKPIALTSTEGQQLVDAEAPAGATTQEDAGDHRAVRRAGGAPRRRPARARCRCARR